MPAYLYFILLSFFASLTVFGWKDSYIIYKFFPIFLLFTFSFEYIGWKIGDLNLPNTPYYNILVGVESLFYMIYIVVILRPFYPLWALLLVPGIYFIGYLLNLFFFQGIDTFNTLTFVPGCAIIIILGLVYFFSLFRYTTSVKLATEPSFWIVSALLFYYICFLPSFGVVNFLISERSTHTYQLFTIVIDLFNYFLYILFTIAFLCKINFRKFL